MRQLLLMVLCLVLASAVRADDWSAWQRALGRHAGDSHGARLQAYERLNRDKLQLFALRDDRTGLGRVFDSRYETCRGEVKFPLGRWKQGEVREYQLDCPRGRQRPAQGLRVLVHVQGNE